MFRSLFTINPAVNLQQGEKLVHMARRHWIVLFLRATPLLLLWLICSAVFLSRLTTTGMDGLNLFLFITGSLLFLGMLYAFFDWRNDVLIITSQRVIFQDATFLVRVQRNELYNRDIQDVSMTTDSIIARQFNYGQINVQTASRLRNIEFRGVASPGLVRDIILRNVDPLKAQEDLGRIHQLVRSKVLGLGLPPAPPPPVDLIPEGEFGSGFLWIIPPSPERRGDTVIWRKHSIFLIVEIMDPLLLMLIMTVAWSLLRTEGFIAATTSSLILVLMIIGALLWMIYEIADWRDDEYIITPTSVIDIERTPFGRESKRETSWDRIEKVSLIQPNIISRIFRYGNIELATAGQQENFTFRRVGSPNRVLAIISDYLDHFQQLRAASAFDDTLLLIKHYHELLQEHQSIAPPNPTIPLPPTQPLP